MLCHECLMEGGESPAVALCQYCQVGLCKAHLIDLYQTLPASLRPCCRHDRRGQPMRPVVSSSGGTGL